MNKLAFTVIAVLLALIGIVVALDKPEATIAPALSILAICFDELIGAIKEKDHASK